jgi:hypothetical protein
VTKDEDGGRPQDVSGQDADVGFLVEQREIGGRRQPAGEGAARVAPASVMAISAPA